MCAICMLWEKGKLTVEEVYDVTNELYYNKEIDIDHIVEIMCKVEPSDDT